MVELFIPLSGTIISRAFDLDLVAAIVEGDPRKALHHRGDAEKCLTPTLLDSTISTSAAICTQVSSALHGTIDALRDVTMPPKRPSA